jgi:hypothetical protein
MLGHVDVRIRIVSKDGGFFVQSVKDSGSGSLVAWVDVVFVAIPGEDELCLVWCASAETSLDIGEAAFWKGAVVEQSEPLLQWAEPKTILDVTTVDVKTRSDSLSHWGEDAGC